jgi:hypothetical protein
MEEETDHSKLKRRKPSTPSPVLDQELIKKVDENEGKKTPTIKPK